MNRFTLIILFSVACAMRLTFGSPDFRTSEVLAGLTLVRDDRSSTLRYYLPSNLAISTSPDGRPAVDVLETRYRGSVVTGDSERTIFRSLLRLSIQIPPPEFAAVEQARKLLGSRVELRPLPLDHISLVVGHLPVDEHGGVHGTNTLPAGIEESQDADSPVKSTWTERHITLRLDPHSTQILADSWRNGRLLLSLGYTIYAAGIPSSEPLSRIEGSPELVAELQRMSRERSNRASVSNAAPVLIKSSALAVSVDAARWPEAWKRYDLNEGIPPGYPILEVRCYDFSDPRMSWLYEKQFVAEAESVAKSRATSRIRFQRSRPDAFAQLAHFRIGVRLDRPFRYRVESIFEDGSTDHTEWSTNQVWSRLIDITEHTGSGLLPERPLP